MNAEEKIGKTTFKYNMSFYYQSTIVYFIVFILYILIRGEFIEGSFTLIMRDPIIYFFGIVVLISLIGLLYNLYRKKHLVIDENGIAFVTRNRTRSFGKEKIVSIRLSKKRKGRRSAFRLVRIRLSERKRPIIIRPSDYENEEELVQKFHALKTEIESR